VFNQFTEEFSVRAIAELIRDAYPGPVRIANIDNPRIEAADHYYHAAHSRLIDLGLEPHLLSDTLIGSLFAIADRYKGRADPSLFRPSVQWTATSNRVGPGGVATHAA
jgi:UDP-sulfoquinovose synthase